LDFKSLLKAEEEEGENGERKTSVKEEEKAGIALIINIRALFQKYFISSFCM